MTSSYPEDSQATTALVLGILGIFFGLLAPFAWYIGNEEVKAIDAGRRPPENRSNAQTGKILGMVMTIVQAVIIGLVLSFVLLYFANTN